MGDGTAAVDSFCEEEFEADEGYYEDDGGCVFGIGEEPSCLDKECFVVSFEGVIVIDFFWYD